MKILPLILFTFIIILKTVLTVDLNEVEVQKWNSFKIQFNKKFESSDEENKKMKPYLKNEKKISEHNARFEQCQETYEMGMNQFGDLTGEEFAQIHLSKPSEYQMQFGVSALSASNQEVDQHFNIAFPPGGVSAPREINWVHKGAITSVKNQKSCGACWAFAVVDGIEAHVFIKTKKLQSLSSQNILDCLGKRYGYDNTCSGGSMYGALQYVVDNGGIETDESYPYVEKQGTCRYNPSKKGASIKDFKRIESGNIGLLRDVVGLIGPVSCNFDVEIDKLQFYKSGVYYSDTCSTKSWNHSLLVVGYDTDVKLDYWLAKNSWGPGWGENGYIRIARTPNTCGIATDPYFPVV